MDRDFPEILLFEVAGQRHAIYSRDIQELLPAMTITPFPSPVPELEGIINLRGVIVLVVAARRCLNLPAKPLAATDHFIVVRAGDRRMALHVDRALELTRLNAGALADVDAVGAGRAGLAQVAKVHDAIVLLHSIEEFIPLLDAHAAGGIRSAPQAEGMPS